MSTKLKELLEEAKKVNAARTAYRKKWITVYSGYGDSAEPIAIHHAGWKDKDASHAVVRFEHAKESDAEFIAFSANNLPVLIQVIERLVEGMEFECGNRCAIGLNPCNGRRTLDDVNETLEQVEQLISGVGE